MSFSFDLHSAAVSDSHLPCRAHAIPDHAVDLKATAQRRPVADLPALGFFRLPHGVPRSLLEAYQSQMQVASMKTDNVYHERRKAHYFGARTRVLV